MLNFLRTCSGDWNICAEYDDTEYTLRGISPFGDTKANCQISDYKTRISLIIPRHTVVAGYYGFTFDVRVSVRPSISRLSVRISFPDDNLSKHQWIFLVCTLILWRSGLGLLMGKFRQILTELSARDTPNFRFRMITLVNINGFSPNLVCALILWRSEAVMKFATPLTPSTVYASRT